MRWTLLFAAFVPNPYAQCAEIHKWVDENGDVQYGNAPPVDVDTQEIKITQPGVPAQSTATNASRDSKKPVTGPTVDDGAERVKKAHEKVREIQRANYDPEKCALATSRAEAIKKRDPLMYSSDVDYFDSTQKISLYCYK